MKRAIAIRHVAFEDLGILAEGLTLRGYQPVHHDAGVADLSSVAMEPGDLLIVLGGPIGAYEDNSYPFLADELRLLERALKRQVAILGICLGAQLLARALGARVYPGAQKEIGIAPIALTAEGRASCLAQLAPHFEVLHWHGDTFDLPAGASCLASTKITPNQAFAMAPKVLGLQFHVEAKPQEIERWLIGHTAELAAAGIDVAELRASLRKSLPGIAERGKAALTAWLDGAEVP